MLTKIKEPAIYGTLIVSAGHFLSGVFAYVLQFALARYLSTSDFGTFNALLSVASIITVPSFILSASLTKLSAELLGKDELQKLTYIFWRMIKYTVIFGICVFFITIGLRHYLADYLNISDMFLISLFAVYLGISFFRVVPLAYLEGLLRFKGYAFTLIVQSLLRLLIPLVLVLMGYSLRGAFGGLFVSAVVTYFISVEVLKKNLPGGYEFDAKDYYHKILAFTLPVFFVQFGMLALNNVDLILVKRFFTEEETGYYASVITLGKLMLFGSGIIATVMFPQISVKYAKKENYNNLFKMFLYVETLLVVAGIVVYYSLPRFLTLLFFGNRFLNAVPYLPKFSLFIGLYVLINFFVVFFLAIEKTAVYMFLVPAVIMQFILINLYHSSLDVVININIGIALVLLISLVLYFFTAQKKDANLQSV